MPKISNVHFAITFDCKTLKPVIKDLGSTCGTLVTFDGEPGMPLSNFEWQLVGPSIAKDQSPVLHITRDVQFKVVVPRHNFTSAGYVEKVNKFLLGTAEPQDLLQSLVLQSGQRTQQPSVQRTPSAGPSLFERVLGKGAFGEVMFPHIVAFLDASFEPYPQLRLEYVPEGSLDQHENFSDLESAKILWQLSSAVEYLHNRNPSIVHRDIKPENILVAERTRGNIYVKFADFGLSKASDVLKTYCCTPLWAAPEFHRKAADFKATKEDTYTADVDIWSLGVVIASLVCGGLPTYEERWQNDADAWVDALQDYFNYAYKELYDGQNDLLWLVMDSMLVKDPDTRSSADYIRDEAGKIVERMEEMKERISSVPVYDGGRGPLTPKLVTVSEASTVVLAHSLEQEGVIVWDETAVAYYADGTGIANAPNHNDDEIPATPRIVSVSEPSAVDSEHKPDLECSIMPLERRGIAGRPNSIREPKNRSSRTQDVPRSLLWKSI
ncbi:protein kinase [Cordyceps javanica]|nr:protein kinase [Cordyceps javanica]